MSRIILQAHEVVDPDYRAISDARWALLEAMCYDVSATLDDEQRKQLMTTLRSYAADMVDSQGLIAIF